MASRSNTLTRAIDQAIGRALQTNGPDGFSYSDIIDLVTDKLGDETNDILLHLGRRKMRESIYDRCRTVGRNVIEELLKDEHIAPIYAVTDEIGVSRFKLAAHLLPGEVSQIIGRLIKDRKGLDAHVKALRRLERRLKKIWAEHPNLNISEAQGYLDLKSAPSSRTLEPAQ